MKIYHILTHSMEQFYPHLKGNMNGFAELKHSPNKFISMLQEFDKENEFEHVMVNLSRTIQGNQLELTHKDGYRLKIIKSFGLFDPLEYSPALNGFVRSTNDGIIHLHGTSSYIYDAAAMELKGKPSVGHYRGGHITLRSFPISFPKYYLLAPYTFNMPTMLFVQNRFVLEDLQKKYNIPYGKMLFVPNTVDTELFKPAEKKKEGICRLLYVGRLVRGKGIPELLNAFSKIRKSHNAELIIAGNGPLEGSVKKTEGVMYAGQIISQQKLSELYRSCDIFVSASHSEGFPNVVLEAMASGLPVVSAKNQGAMDLVVDGKTGFLFKIGDEEELAGKLMILLEDEKMRREFGLKGRERAIEVYAPDRIAEKVLESYKMIWPRIK